MFFYCFVDTVPLATEFDEIRYYVPRFNILSLGNVIKLESAKTNIGARALNCTNAPLAPSF